MNSIRLFTTKTVLDFGKYKGRTIESILDEDIRYIRWMVENMEDVIYSGRILLEVKYVSREQDDEWPTDSDVIDYFRE